MKDIYIVGAGGLAREVSWLIDDINQKEPTWNIIGYIDENEENIGKELNGHKVLGNIEYLNEQKKSIVMIGIGSGLVREKIVKQIKNHEYTTLIHPSVVISKYSNIGKGSIICAGTIVSVNVDIKEQVFVNLACTIGHDVILENYTTILPGTNVSGNVAIGEYSTTGTGSAIIQQKRIGKNVMIGAGAVVNKDIPDNVTAVGVPAKIIK